MSGKYDKEKDIAEWLEKQGEGETLESPKKDWRATPQAKYKAKVNRKIGIDFITTTEADMLEWLDKQPAKATYIKRLIREDMERNNGK